jgi:hypothetical protein
MPLKQFAGYSDGNVVGSGSITTVHVSPQPDRFDPSLYRWSGKRLPAKKFGKSR